MKEIIATLRQMGEKVTYKNNEIKVNFSWLLGNLTIKKDIATNQLVYSYQQTADLFSAVIIIAFSATLINIQSYSVAAVCIAVGLLRFTASIIKEIKVTAIKKELMKVSLLNNEKPALISEALI
jgi:hypothetical protein